MVFTRDKRFYKVDSAFNKAESVFHGAIEEVFKLQGQVRFSSEKQLGKPHSNNTGRQVCVWKEEQVFLGIQIKCGV